MVSGARTAFAVSAFIFASASQAQTAADFYKGKQINIYAGSSAGGGYDTYARLLGRHIGRHIPGNPTVVVSNMPGAAGKTVTAFIANVAPRDGTAITGTYPQAITDPLFTDRKKSPFDPEKLLYVGSMEGESYLCFVRADAPVKTMHDLLQKELIVGGSAPGASMVQSPALLNNLIGTKFQLVMGYKGSREVTLAALRGEIMGWCGMGWSASQAVVRGELERGELRILFQENGEETELTRRLNIPRATELARNDEDRRVMNLIYSQQRFGRPYITTPGVPADRLAALRKAFDETLADPQLIEDAKKLNIRVSLMRGEELQKVVTELYQTPEALVEKAKRALDITNVVKR
jgi:tripartite-type tricarboxylate transporter receptor subunit TctC